MSGPGRPKIDPTIRFWTKIARTGGCWNWTDALNADGYGRLGIGDGRKMLAHRFSWEMHGLGTLGRQKLDHRCLNRRCVKPEHLRIATQSQNNQNYAGAQRRNPTGARGVTLTGVKTRRGKPYKALATLNGVTHYGGRFYTIDEAAEAARQLRLLLFTHNDLDRSAA